MTIEDPWAWLRDPGYPKVEDEEVLAYLKAENAYFEAAMKPHKALVETLFEEMKGRIKEDDCSVPLKDGDWLYWWAFKPGAQYRSWYRRKLAGGDADELIFDEPAEAEGKEYFRLGAIAVSPTASSLATLVDDDGSERFKLRIRDLATGKDIETVTDVGIGQPVWTSDSQGLVFTEVNDKWRSYRARYHRLGDDPAESGRRSTRRPRTSASRSASRGRTDRSLIFISTGDNTTSEVRFVPADDPTAAPVLIARAPARTANIRSTRRTGNCGS